MLEHRLPSGIVVIGMGDRIVSRRILGNAGDAGAFGKGEVRYTLVEIALRCCLNTEGILSEIDRVQIILKYFSL